MSISRNSRATRIRLASKKFAYVYHFFKEKKGI
jgi:hypothetical protein